MTAASFLHVQGTIRSNLDPLRRHNDRELIAVLKQVRLWDVLCGLSLSHAKAEQATTSQIAAPASSALASIVPMPVGEMLDLGC